MSPADLPVHVGPDRRPELEAAVVDGGGRIVGLPDAVGVVYHGSDDPQEAAGMIHAGVRWLQLPHAGVEKWTAAGVVTRDPVWTSAAGAYGPQIAEHALALMLMAARQLHHLARADHWTTSRTRTLDGTTAALVGFGGIGRSLLPLLNALGCEVLAVTDSGNVPAARRTVPRARYRDVLPDADFVVLLAPLTPVTQGMISSAELAMMRPDSWLVNVGRGGLVVTDDLTEALRRGTVAGAALDVTEPEPLPDGHPLWSMSNAVITPHVANPPDARSRTLVRRVTDNVSRLVADEPLLGVIDPDQGF